MCKFTYCILNLLLDDDIGKIGNISYIGYQTQCIGYLRLYSGLCYQAEYIVELDPKQHIYNIITSLHQVL